MDVREYLKIGIKNWRILLASIFVTVAATVVFTMRQPRIYESLSSFVIRPHSSLIVQDEFVSTLDTLSRRVEINNTFAEVTNSSLIKDRATEQLGLTKEQRQGLSASGRVLVGTNILELTVEGRDPEITQAFAEAVSRETVNYVSSLYDVFELGQLDGASLPRRPISPNTTVNIVLGLVLGIGLGLMMIFLYEYVREPRGPGRNFEIIDPDTGVYNRAYLEMRLRQEVSRAQRNNGTFSLALIGLKQRGSASGGGDIGREAMPSVAIIFDPLLRDEDLLARYDESTFALLLPDMSGAEAQAAVEIMRLRMGSAPVAPDQSAHVTGLRGAAGVAELSSGDHDEMNLFLRAQDALRDAERGTYGRVILRSPAADTTVHQPAADTQARPVKGGPAIGAATNGNGAATKSDEQPPAIQPVQKPPLTRAALKLAQQHGIDPDTVAGSGKDGRVLKSDVKALINADPELGFST